MAEMDRSKRYANSPKAGKKGMQNKDERKAEGGVAAAEGKEGKHEGPTDQHPGKVGKVGEDKGPDGGASSTMGVMHERHASEREDMHKRHHMEMTQMHDRHATEHKDMHKRHHEETQNHEEAGAEKKIDATAGKPEELGKDKSEGKKGSEA